MSWDEIIGQSRVKQLLKRAIQNGQVPHAYLFYGPDGVGKDALAIEFAKVLNCLEQGSIACDRCTSCRKFDTLQHPNVRFIVALPVGKNEKQGDDPVLTLSDDQVETIQEQMRAKANDRYHAVSVPKANFIKINSIREIKREAALSRFEGGRKVFIISHAEQMNADASNSLLKTLEEPLGDTVLLLTTSQRDQLLPTIISRCQLLACDPLKDSDIESALIKRDDASPQQANLAARMSGGSYSAARELLTHDIVQERQEVVQFLRAALSHQKIMLVNAVEDIASSHDKNGMDRWLKLLQSWLREALVLREGGIQSAVSEDGKSLQTFVQNFPEADLVGAEEAVERGIAHLRKNVYLPLVLAKLALDLRKCIPRQL